MTPLNYNFNKDKNKLSQCDEKYRDRIQISQRHAITLSITIPSTEAITKTITETITLAITIPITETITLQKRKI